jgi:hypothetical protein
LSDPSTDEDAWIYRPGAAFDGSTLGGFMATLGLFRLASGPTSGDRCTLSWRFDATWTPRIRCQLPADRLADRVASRLRASADLLASHLASDESIAAEVFRDVERHMPGSPESRGEMLRWLAGLGSDGCTRADEGNSLETSPLKTLGGGRQRFLPTMRAMFAATDADRIHSCLVGSPDQIEPGTSLRWNPRDDRRHAYRWTDPSKDPLLVAPTMEALAAAAIPCFPTAPGPSGLSTTGFRRSPWGLELTWPIWTVPLELPAVLDLIAHRSLATERPDRNALQELGVREVYRCRRLSVDRYVNFSPSWSP